MEQHFKVLKENNFQSRVLCPMNIASKNRDKTFSEEIKPREFVASKTALKVILKKGPHFKGKLYQKET